METARRGVGCDQIENKKKKKTNARQWLPNNSINHKAGEPIEVNAKKDRMNQESTRIKMKYEDSSVSS